MMRRAYSLRWSVPSITRFVLLASTAMNCAYAQSSATVEMDHGDVTAGDTITMTLKFDQPATCEQGVIVDIAQSAPRGSYEFLGQLRANSDTATAQLTLPKDTPAGQYRNNNSALLPCQGYSQYKKLSISDVVLNVKSLPDPNSYPTTAIATLSLTQKQFLATKISELDDLSGQIDTRIEENGSDDAQLRAFLAKLVESAQAALVKTKSQYRTQMLKATDPRPTFFADFERQYANLLIEIKAPIPGTRAALQPSGRLVYVQLQPRSPAEAKPKGRNLSGTSPAIAKAVKTVVDDNAAAYGVVRSTGRPVFYAQFTSIPTGAMLYYRQAIQPDFKVWSSTTNIAAQEFELATFVFKFHKDECKDEPVRTIDPYSDTHPNVSVEFRQCSKR
jgi:hypothetical protein